MIVKGKNDYMAVQKVEDSVEESVKLERDNIKTQENRKPTTRADRRMVRYRRSRNILSNRSGGYKVPSRNNIDRKWATNNISC